MREPSGTSGESRVSDAEFDAEAAPESRFRAHQPNHPDRPKVWAVLLASIALASCFPAAEAVGEF
ncbi:MAG: hypothetical protein ACKOHK_09860, partial [Planctomycetia bacterium]